MVPYVPSCITCTRYTSSEYFRGISEQNNFFLIVLGLRTPSIRADINDNFMYCLTKKALLKDYAKDMTTCISAALVPTSYVNVRL